MITQFAIFRCRIFILLAQFRKANRKKQSFTSGKFFLMINLCGHAKPTLHIKLSGQLKNSLRLRMINWYACAFLVSFCINTSNAIISILTFDQKLFLAKMFNRNDEIGSVRLDSIELTKIQFQSSFNCVCTIG